MAQAQRWGFSLPLEGVSLADHRQLIQEAERDGYTDAWTLEVDGADCFTPLALTAAWSERLRLGTAVANVYTRTPSVLAMSAAAMSEAAPGRFVLGVGSSSPAIVQEWGGLPFVEPFAQTRDTVLALRDLLAGQRVTVDTERIHIHGLRLSRPPAGDVPLYVAGLRAGMLRLAGRMGDGVMINWLAPTDVPKVVSIAKQATVDAGRDPDALDVVCRIFVFVGDDVEAARTRGRREIAAYLTTPVYEAFHVWLGRGETLRRMTEAWRAGDRRGAVAQIPDSVVDELLVIGSAEQCRRRVQEYVDNGVTTPVLHFMPAGATPETLGRMSSDALRALAPARW